MFFQIGKGKEGCGRVVVRRQLGIVNAYTMEASFMGADQVPDRCFLNISVKQHASQPTTMRALCIIVQLLRSARDIHTKSASA